MKPSVSFFCPAYFDEQNLPRLIPEVVSMLEETAQDYDILIIEDGSPDRTGEVADLLAKKFPHVRVTHHARNLGYGATIAEGFREANRYDWCLTTDGDRQYDITEFKTFLPYLNDYDAIIGFRRQRQMSPYRKFQSSVYNGLVRALFGLPFRDINCSFKLVRRNFLNKIFLTSRSAFIDAELLLKLRAAGARILELPVTHFARTHGKASGASGKVVAGSAKEMAAYFFARR